MTLPWETQLLRVHAVGTGIDMGCGRLKLGSFGVDISPDSAADLFCDFAQVPLPTESQEYILSCHSLEHHADTCLVLREWHRLLRHGGTLAIIVPNGELPLAGILGDTTGTHKQLFTPATLPKFLAFCGFVIDHTSARQKSLFVLGHKP